MLAADDDFVPVDYAEFELHQHTPAQDDRWSTHNRRYKFGSNKPTEH